MTTATETTAPETAHPIPAGSMARVATDTQDLASGRTLHKHLTFEVEEYVTAEDSEDGKAYYVGWQDDLASLEVDANDVVLDMTPEQMDARQLPSANQIVNGIDVLVDGDAFRTTEAEAAADGKTTVYGQTPDGLKFSFTVAISDITRI